jgi:1-acyl-sn-glycerol-3-phosphate acyltransferase
VDASSPPPRPHRWAAALLRLLGWQVLFEPLPGPRGVVIVYPHTSNWDFAVGYLARLAIGLPFRWIGKDTLFRWPVAGLLRRMGGTPVNRREPTGLIGRLAAEVTGQPWMWLVLAPEGTRSHTDHWKSGFYHLALAAHLPVGLAFIDYRGRSVGLTTYLSPSGDEEKDLGALRAFYADKVGRFPGQASDIRFRAERGG